MRTHAAFSLALALAVAPAALADLAGRVGEAVAQCGLRKATIAVSLRDTATGALECSRNGSLPLVPASNWKLVTTGAALERLGPEFAFRTRLLLDGDRLVVVGDGDPAFGDPELLAGLVSVAPDGTVRQGMDVERLLEAWADAAARSCPATLREVVADARIFESAPIHPGWPQDQLEESYCAEVWGLNFHANRLHFLPRPAGGSAVAGDATPRAPWLLVGSDASARQGKKDTNTAWFKRGADSLTLQGNVKSAYAEPVMVMVRDAPTFFARLLASRLAERGIHVAVARSASPTDAQPSGATVGPIVQTPLGTALSRANTDSENLYAECLLKRATAAARAAPGGWESGALFLRDTLMARIGADAAGFACSDGSGLSRQNRVTADGLTAWLASFARDGKLAQPYFDSLARAGHTGTVRKRLKGLDAMGVVASCKSGYINGTSCLSGLVSAPGTAPIAFSILCNDLTEAGALDKAKKLQDRIVLLVAEEIRARANHPALGG